MSRREEIVREHVATENRHDFEATLRTFARARYEVIASNETHDGERAVRAFLEETYAAFPDMSLEHKALHHAGDAVIVEATFRGTHLGPYRGLPATHARVEYAMCNVFMFEGDDLVCERLYFDRLALLTQLGIASDPLSLRGRVSMAINHPITIARAFVRGAFASSRKSG